MNVHIDFSMFIADGAAFGKATLDGSLESGVKAGEVLHLPSLAVNTGCRVSNAGVDLLVDGVVGGLTVRSVAPLDSGQSADIHLIELEDVVFESRDIARLVVNALVEIGFDCDIWDE